MNQHDFVRALEKQSTHTGLNYKYIFGSRDYIGKRRDRNR